MNKIGWDHLEAKAATNDDINGLWLDTSKRPESDIIKALIVRVREDETELERLRDLIVGKSDGDSARDEDGCFRRRQRGVAKFEADHEAFEAEADLIRAAREAGKD